MMNRRATKNPIDSTLRANPDAHHDRTTLLLWAAFVTLAVATPLVPSETTLQFGGHVLLVALWNLLLLAWLLTSLIKPQVRVVWNPALTCIAAIAVWIGLSALVNAPQNNVRFSLNIAWYWECAAVIAFLAAQLVRSPEHARGLAAALFALSVGLACFAIYQSCYSLALQRAQFESHPDHLLANEGWFAPPGSTQRQYFADRIRSDKPSATFAAPQSLATFLVPWLVLAVCASYRLPGLPTNAPPSSPASRISWKIAVLSCFLALIATSLWLTQCSTSIAAALLGIGIGAWLRRRVHRESETDNAPPRITPRRRAITLFLFVAVALVVTYAVLLSAGWLVDFRDRWNLWHASAMMILAHPLLGCGPGNFSNFYSHYNPVHAKSVASDPLNCLLEVWATAGTPAALLFLLAFGCWARQLIPLARREPNSPRPPNDESGQTGDHSASTTRLLLGGAGLGMLLGWPLSFLSGFPSEWFHLPGAWAWPAWLVVGFPPAVFTLYLLVPWMRDGQWLPAAPGIALACLLLNLLVAPGIAYPGVALSLWILGPAALAHSNATLRETCVPKRWAILALALAVVMFGGMLQSEYAPILGVRRLAAEADALHIAGRNWLHAGNSSQAYSDLRNAERMLLEAGQADPFTPVFWEKLADVRRLLWIIQPDNDALASFQQAIDEATRRDPASALWRQKSGQLFLQVYRNSHEPDHLMRAIDAFNESIQLGPHKAFAHAQLAWALHLHHDRQAAAMAASEALRIDRLQPPSEEKLKWQSFSDLDPNPQPPQTANQLPNSQQSIEEVLLHLLELPVQP